jgi:hypothetical protein
MATITAANAVLILSVPTLLPVATQLQGFSADAVFDAEDIDATDVVMGVDGILSGGMVFAASPMNFSLQADSPSITFFEAWYAGQKAAIEAFPAQGNVTLTTIGRNYQLVTGFLSRYKPIADAHRILQPQRFRITWQSIIPSPIGVAG